MNETAIGALFDYLAKEPEPQVEWPESEFEQSTYSRWAAGELIDMLTDHPLEPAEDVVFDFIMKMTACMVISGEKPAGIPFSIAADFAYNCLETLF